MHIGRNYGLFEALWWTRKDILRFLVIAAIPTALFVVFDMTYIAVPWVPIALVGTAVAFIVGFKNNATYERMWEARKIWGGIVNASRTWGIFSKDFVTNAHASETLSEEGLKEIHHRLIYRHMGWITALRFQLREPRPWEYMEKRSNREYRKNFHVVEQVENLSDYLPKYLSEEEYAYVMKKKNIATQIITLQSKDIHGLMNKGYIEDFRHMELENILKQTFELQGKSERIKNFPYPRQFATLNVFFVWLFIILVPLGLLNEFDKLGEGFAWLTIPFSTLVAWVFHTMERIGESTENPFEGGPNDVPITSLARTIEIDLKEMLDEEDIPEPIEPFHKILM